MKPIENEMDAIMAFLDADSYEEKYLVLTSIYDVLTDHVIDTLAASIDVVIQDGDLDMRFEELKSCLSTFRRFEVSRRR